MSPANSIGFPFIELHTVDSTNNYAMGLIHAGMAQHGTAIFAHEQINGKGQRGKQWHSAKNENIILSIIIKPFGLNSSQIFLFNMATAIAVYTFFSRYAGKETKIKWPNDLYWRDRKAGGILIENVVQGTEWKYAVVGIGLNINQTNFNNVETKAVSLKQITGKTFDPVEMAKELIADLNSSFSQVTVNSGHIIAMYLSHLYKHNQMVKLKHKEGIFDAVIKGVTIEGLLIVEHQTEEQFHAGEVEWVG